MPLLTTLINTLIHSYTHDLDDVVRAITQWLHENEKFPTYAAVAVKVVHLAVAALERTARELPAPAHEPAPRFYTVYCHHNKKKRGFYPSLVVLCRLRGKVYRTIPINNAVTIGIVHVVYLYFQRAIVHNVVVNGVNSLYK